MVNTNKENLESYINYFFNNKELMIRALTHSSLVKKDDSYETLEFLGDSILNYAITKYLFFKYNKLNEGELTKKKSRLVNSHTLTKAAKRINLESYILIGPSLKRIPNKIISDCYEALIAAIYLDSNLESAEKFIKETLLDYLDFVETEMNYKGKLIELCSSRKISAPIFHTEISKKNMFRTKIEIKSLNIVTYDLGKTIKQAERNASKKILKSI